MPDRKIFARCANCDTPIYTKPSKGHLGGPRHCRKPECLSARMKGDSNPFWGKAHTSETKAKIASVKTGKPSGAKGITKRPLTLQEKKLRSEAMKLEWAKNRDRRLECLTRGDDHHWKKPHEEIRHRLRFTEFQRREWTAKSCMWCDSTENLILDHIMPIAAGGKCVQENAQTLCQPCNLWKMWYVDRPLAVYAKATSGA
jgi:5-methylcytosine-specific restriction endonuclease McrA